MIDKTETETKAIQEARRPFAEVIDELGLSTEGSGEVLYAAFTGKAALVMTRKGTPASTIHSLIYRVSEATPQEIEKLEKEAAEIRGGLHRLGVAERLFEEARLRSLELRLKDAHKPRFVLNAESPCATASSSSSTRSRWSARRWRATCSPSASRPSCSVIPASSRR